MDNSNKQRFAQLFYGAGEYYDKAISEQLLIMYFNGLSHYSIEEVELALNGHMQDPDRGRWFPKIADFSHKLEGSKLSAEERAEIAWAEIEQKIRTVGSYGSLKLEDGVALAALKGFTSWKDLCAMDVTKMTWAKKEFMSLYGTYDRAPIESLPKALPGRVELEKQKANSAGYLCDIKKGLEDFKNKLDNKEG